MRRPDVIVFDVVHTLASLDEVGRRLAAAGLPGHTLGAWFSRLIRDGMALTLAGGYRPFAEVAASALATETGGRLDPDQVEDIVAGFGALTPQPDAVAAVEAATGSGMRVFALTNGNAESTAGFLDRAGIGDAFERVLSIDQASAWKPDPAVYRLAVDAAGLPPEQLALVAVHAWDVHGAHRAGLTTGWCSRFEQTFGPAFDTADVVADTLDGVVRELAALPR